MINFTAIGQRIKTIRKERNMTQEALAEYLNISPEYMSRIESGNCRASYGLIESISAVFNVPESEIMFGLQCENAVNTELYARIDSLPAKKKQALMNILDLIE